MPTETERMLTAGSEEPTGSILPPDRAAAAGAGSTVDAGIGLGGLREPRWLTVSGDVPTGERALAHWLELLLQEPACSVHLHPHLVLAASLRGEEIPLVHARWERAPDGGERLDALAALVGKTVRLPLLSGVPGGVSLRGHRVVGNQLLGSNSAAGVDDLVQCLLGLFARGESACVLFEDLEVGSALRTALTALGTRRSAAAVHYPVEPQAHWWIRFPEKPEDYWRQFSSKTRYNLRRQARRLEHRLLCFRTPEEVPSLLAKANQVSRASWQTRRLGLRVSNTPRERAFWEAQARCGALRSYVLEQGDRPLAFVLGTQWQGCFAYEEIGFDPAFAEYSPGTVLLFRLLEELIAHDPPRLFDFGLGDGGSKRLFANHETASGPVLLVRRTWKSMTALRMHRLGHTFSRRLRSCLQRLGMLSALRRVYRRS